VIPPEISTQLEQAALFGDDLGQALLIIGVILVVAFALPFLLARLEPPRAQTRRSARNDSVQRAVGQAATLRAAPQRSPRR
jgi:hypothetical protein